MKTTAQSIPTTEDLRSGLQLAIESREHELTSLKQALAWLNTPAPAAAPQEKPERQATQKPGRKPKAERTPKKSKKGPRPTTRREPADADAPRARKGHVPKKGVEQLYCPTLEERKAKTGELKAAGFRRIGPGEPLSAGTYDVRPSGDEDESCVVLWRAKAEVDGE